jgi:hypothetical protein
MAQFGQPFMAAQVMGRFLQNLKHRGIPGPMLFAVVLDTNLELFPCLR